MNYVSGQKEPIIKLLRELQTEDGRYKNGLYFVEGDEIVKRSLLYGGKLKYALVSEAFTTTKTGIDFINQLNAAGVDLYCASSGLISKIMGAKPIPDCLAVIERKPSKLADIFNKESSLIQIVESVENADNLGMLLRTTDACSVDGVVLTDKTADPYSRKVVRGSRGAVYTMPLCVNVNIADTIKSAKEAGFQVIATSANVDAFYWDVDYTKPTAFIVGNEHTGISDVVKEMADMVVKIPMSGKINSLNVAVAASMVLYEAIRQRR